MRVSFILMIVMIILFYISDIDKKVNKLGYKIEKLEREIDKNNKLIQELIMLKN